MNPECIFCRLCLYVISQITSTHLREIWFEGTPNLVNYIKSLFAKISASFQPTWDYSLLSFPGHHSLPVDKISPIGKFSHFDSVLFGNFVVQCFCTYRELPTSLIGNPEYGDGEENFHSVWNPGRKRYNGQRFRNELFNYCTIMYLEWWIREVSNGNDERNFSLVSVSPLDTRIWYI